MRAIPWLAFTSCLLVAACEAPESRKIHRITGTTLGTSYSLSLACDLDVKLARATAEAAFEKVDLSMSTYRPDSELMTFNRAPVGQWFGVSEEFAEVVAASLSIARISAGAFDPTLGALVELWGFGAAERLPGLPAADEVSLLLQSSGFSKLEIQADSPAIRRLDNISLDLSAIAKGYAVDLAIKALEAKACRHLLVEVGGEVAAKGYRPGGGNWRIGVESPTGDGAPAMAVSLFNEAIATSGGYRNFVQIGKEIYSHTIDPDTGYPVQHALASVSVVSDSAMGADALATAINVMGPVDGPAFAEQHGIEAFFIIRTEKGYDSFGSGRFDGS